MASRSSSLTVRLAAILAISALASGILSGWITYRFARADFLGIAQEKYLALMQVRAQTLEAYLASVREETRFWNKNGIMRQALREFRGAWAELGDDPTGTLQRLYIDENPYPEGIKDNLETAGDDSSYSRVHHRFHYWLRSFLVHRGVYDLFLFDPDGNLVYTSFKETDFATNLNTGPFRDSDLGRAFRVALENPYPSFVSFFDFAPYEPSHGAPASFFSSPVLDDAGELLGVIAFQIPAARIDEIMQVQAGMGESGETYAVGEDLLMRSSSRFSEQSTTLKTTVDTPTVRRALAGETGIEITDDYRGIPVVSAYGPLEFEGVHWAVMAEIDEAEVCAPLDRLRWIALLSGTCVGLAAAALAFIVAR
jgi:methyl-accepting chemotaxis protein